MDPNPNTFNTIYKPVNEDKKSLVRLFTEQNWIIGTGTFVNKSAHNQSLSEVKALYLYSFVFVLTWDLFSDCLPNTTPQCTTLIPWYPTLPSLPTPPPPSVRGVWASLQSQRGRVRRGVAVTTYSSQCWPPCTEPFIWQQLYLLCFLFR